MKLEADLRAEFIAETEAAHRPASQVMRELMRDYIAKQREAREYHEYLQKKVDIARAQLRAGLGRPDSEVRAEFAALRAEALARK